MASGKSTKRIPVGKKVWKELGKMKEAGETYNELLRKVIKDHYRHELAEKARRAREGKGEWVKLGEE